MPFTVLDSTVTSGATASIVVSYPGGAPASGDLLVLGANSNATMTTPSGWTLSTGASDVHNEAAYVWWRIAGAAEASSVTAGNSANNTSISFRRYSGAAGSPLDSASSAFVINTSGSSTPALTTASLASGDLLLCYAMNHNMGSIGGTSPAWSGGPSQVATAPLSNSGATGSHTQHFVGELLSAAGGTVSPSCTWSTNTAQNRTIIAIAFKVAPAGPQTPLIVPQAVKRAASY